MAEYAVPIYTDDSAHAPDATPEDRQESDDHADELASSGSMLAAYALTPRDLDPCRRHRAGPLRRR
jgi:hypothetical protein